MLFSGGRKGQCGVSNTVVVSANNRRKMLFMPQKKRRNFHRIMVKISYQTFEEK